MNDILKQLGLAGKPVQRPAAVFDGLAYSAENDMAAAELSNLRIGTAAGV